MKLFAKRFLAMALIVAGSLSGLSLHDAKAAGELERIRKAGVIRVSIYGDMPPFCYIDENGVAQGYDVYFARRLAKDLLGDESKVVFVPVEPAARVESVAAGKVDLVLANFTKTPERAKRVDFALPYMRVALGVVSPEGAPVTNVEQLKGKKLIVAKGTTADLYFTKNHPEIDLVKFEQNTEAFNALYDGRAPALAHDNSIVMAWAGKTPGFTVGIEDLGPQEFIAPAVRQGNKELLDWVNAEIVRLGEEQFFHKNFEATMRPTFGPKVSADAIVVEGGKTD